MKKLLPFFILLSILLTIPAFAGLGINVPPQGTAAELTTGTATGARIWSPKTLADTFSGASAEVVNEAVSQANFESDETHAASQGALYTYFVQHDSDLDGLPDAVEADVLTIAMLADSEFSANVKAILGAADYAAIGDLLWSDLEAGDIPALSYEPADATIVKSDEAETITANWVNTDNPWADNEVADDISLTNITQITNRAITSLSATNWRLFYSADGGVPVELALGADGTYLKSNGAAVAPSFDTPDGLGDMTKAEYDSNDDGEIDDGAIPSAMARDSELHSAVTVGTANGMSLTGGGSPQEINLAAATNSTPGAATAAQITALEANTLMKSAWAMTALTSAPGSPAGGTLYRADGAASGGWDPVTYNPSGDADRDYFVIYDADTTTYVAMFDENGIWLISEIDIGEGTLEIPNSDDPDVDTVGQIALDTDGWLRIFNGSIQYGKPITETIHVTVISPNDFADATRDAFVFWRNTSGMSFVVTHWYAESDTDDTTLNIEETDADGANNATVDAVEIATDGTGIYTADDGTITAATIEDGHRLLIDFDDTDDPGQVKLTIVGYYNGDVD